MSEQQWPQVIRDAVTHAVEDCEPFITEEPLSAAETADVILAALAPYFVRTSPDFPRPEPFVLNEHVLRFEEETTRLAKAVAEVAGEMMRSANPDDPAKYGWALYYSSKLVTAIEGRS